MLTWFPSYLFGYSRCFSAVVKLSVTNCCLLQAQFSQMRPVPMTQTVGPRMQMLPPGVPVGQQMFYGQPPAFINPQVSRVKNLTVHNIIMLSAC